MSRIILPQIDSFLPKASDRVIIPMRRRLPVKEVLARRMKQAGRNTPALVARAKERGAHLTESNLKAILSGSTLAPSVFTCEALALGLDIPPLQFIAELLDRGEDPALETGKFSNLASIYRELKTPSQKQKADAFIDGLLLQLQHIKNQPK